MATPKTHWAFGGDETTKCGLDVNPTQAVWWNATPPTVTALRLEATCKACLRHNPGSISKERAWHRVRRGEGYTDCGMQRERHHWQSEIHKTYKDPEVTCGRCLRSMRVRVRRRAA